MRRGLVVYSCRLLVAAAFLAGGPAFADQVYDDQLGTATDQLQDGAGIASTAGLTYDGAETWALSAGASSGTLTTRLVRPASAKAWRKLALRGTFPVTGNVSVDVLSSTGDLLATLPVASVSGGVVADLSAIAPSNAALAFRVTLARGSSPIAPVIDAIEASWEPLSVVNVGVTASASRCTGTDINYQVAVSVSAVGAEGLVVVLDPPAASGLPFVQSADLTLSSATQGGRMNTSGGALTVAGVTVPQGAVYWTFASTIKPGTTFLLNAALRVPNGLAEEAVYSTQARVDAQNADPRVSASAATQIDADPRPTIRMSHSNVFRILGQDYADAGAAITATVTVANTSPSRGSCEQTYFQGVVVYDLTGFYDLGAIAVGPDADTDDGGQFIADDGLPHVFFGKVVYGPAVVFPYGDFGVGAAHSFHLDLVLEDAPPLHAGTDVIDTHAYVISGHDPESAATTGEINIGVPTLPFGTYALGQANASRSSVIGGYDDLATYAAAYLEPIRLPMVTSNVGPSSLNAVHNFQRVPDGLQFVAFSAPLTGSAATALRPTLYYSASHAAGPPPGYDPATGTLDASWTATPPADPSTVGWVVAVYPELASPFFPRTIPVGGVDVPVPSGVRAELTVRSLPPTDGCAETAFQGEAWFAYNGYTPHSGGLTAIAGALFKDVDQIVVRPVLPSFVASSAASAPQTRVGAGTVRYDFNVRNTHPDGSPTKTAGNVGTTPPIPVVFDVTFPTVTKDGVREPMRFVGVNAAGGAVTLKGGSPPTGLTITWPTLGADLGKQVSVDLFWGQGAQNDEVATISGTVSTTDDICPGVIKQTVTAQTRVEVTPYLALSKSVDYEAAATGDLVRYTLSAVNVGDAVSTRTLLFDRVPTYTTFEGGAPVPGGGKWYFSATAPPALPATLADPIPFDAGLLTSGGFVEGQLVGGKWQPPAGMTALMFAVDLDDHALSPARFVTGHAVTVAFDARVVATAPTDAVISNRAIIDADLVLGALSNLVRTVVTDHPAARITSAVTPVMASPGTGTLTATFHNSSTSPADGFVVTTRLPADLDYVAGSAVFVFNDAAAEYAGIAVTPTISGDGKLLTWDVTAAVAAAKGQGEPFEPLYGGHFDIGVTSAAGLADGTFLTAVSQVTVSNAVAPSGLTFSATAQTRVASADVTVAGLVDNARPVQGADVGYTFLVSNAGELAAADSTFSVTLPENLAYIAGTAQLTTAGYGFQGGQSEPHVAGNVLTWSTAYGNALTATGGTPGTLAGSSPQLAVYFQAHVADDTEPDTDLTAHAAVSTTTGEGLNLLPNDADVAARTPLADLQLTASAPVTALPGDVVTYGFVYDNLSPQNAKDSVVVIALPVAAGTPTVSVVSVNAPSGTLTYYSGSATAPFDAADTANWSTTAPAEVAQVAVLVGPVLGEGGAKAITVQTRLQAPNDGPQPIAGDVLTLTGTIYQVNDPTAESDLSNNEAGASVTTPGINLAAAVAITPGGSYPGVVAGDPVTIEATVSNTGTVTAFGVVTTLTLPNGLSTLSDDALTATLVDSSGSPVAAVAPNGAAIVGAIPVTRVGGSYYLGRDSDPSSDPLAHTNIGMPAGTHLSFTTSARAGSQLADATSVTATFEVLSHNVTGWVQGDPAEEFLGDNAAHASVTVRKADLLLDKAMAPASGAGAGVGLGDRVAVDVAYDNVGSADAREVSFTDYLPAGTALVPSSMSNVGSDFTVSYLAEGGWGYTPTVAAGESDPNIKAFRLSAASVASPANSYFAASSGEQLAAGATFDGSAVAGARVQATHAGGTYTSGLIPADGSVVRAWQTIHVGDVQPSNAAVQVTVLDGTSGAPLAGFEGLSLDEGGNVDVSGLSTSVRSVRLRLTFGEGGPAPIFDYTDGSTVDLPAPSADYVPDYPWGADYNANVGAFNARGDLATWTTSGYGGLFSLILNNGRNTRVKLIYDTDLQPLYFDDGAVVLVDPNGDDKRIVVFTPRTDSLQWQKVYDDAAGFLDLPRVARHAATGRLMMAGKATGGIRVLAEQAGGGLAPVAGPWFSNQQSLSVQAATAVGFLIGGSPMGLGELTADPTLSTFSATPVALASGAMAYQGFSFDAAQPDGSAYCDTQNFGAAGVIAVVHVFDPATGTYSAAPLPGIDGSTARRCSGVLADNVFVGDDGSQYLTWSPNGSGGYSAHTIPGGYSSYPFPLSDGTLASVNYAPARYHGGVSVWRPTGPGTYADPTNLGWPDWSISGFNVLYQRSSTGGRGGFPISNNQSGGPPYRNYALTPDSNNPTGYRYTRLKLPVGTDSGYPWLPGEVGPHGRVAAYTVTSGYPQSPVIWDVESDFTFTQPFQRDVNGTDGNATDGNATAIGQILPLVYNFNGNVRTTGGLFAAGDWSNPADQNDTFNPDTLEAGSGLVWYPDPARTGTPAAPDGWAYANLLEPKGVFGVTPYMVTAEGVVLGQGVDPRKKPVTMVWHRQSDDTWTPTSLEYTDEYDVTSPITLIAGGSDRTSFSNPGGVPNYSGRYVKGTANGSDVYVFPSATEPSGFAVLGLPLNGGQTRVTAVDVAGGMIAGVLDEDGYVPGFVAYRDGAGAQNIDRLRLPDGTMQGGAVDAHDGFVLGTAQDDGSPYSMAVLWRQEGDRYWPATVLASDASQIVGLGPAGKAVIKARFGASEASYAVMTVDANGVVHRAPIAGGAAGLGSWNSPYALPALRDGFAVLYGSDSQGATLLFVVDFRAGADPSYPLIALPNGVGDLLYNRDGGFVTYNSASRDYGFIKILANGATEVTPWDGDSTYYPSQQLFTEAVARLGSEYKGWVPESGNGGVVIEAGAHGTSPVHLMPGSVGRFANSSDLRIWGARMVERTASFGGLSLRYRSDARPSFGYELEVLDLCQAGITNTIAASTSTPQVSTDNDQSEASLDVIATDVAIALTADKTLVVAGGAVTYTVTVTNNGPSSVNDVHFSLTGPAASDLGTVVGVVAGGGAIAAGTSESFTFTAHVAAGSADGATLAASASLVDGAAPFIDCQRANDVASVSGAVSNLPNVFVNLSAPATAQSGEVFVVTMTYGNSSDTAAHDVSVTFTPPTGFALVDPGQETTFTYGTFPAGGTPLTQTFALRAVGGCDGDDDVAESVATITASDDVLASDNEAGAETAITAPSGALTVAVLADQSALTTNGLVRWTLHYRNAGDGAVGDAVLTAPIPSGATFVPGSLSSGSFANGVVTATLGTVPAGEAGAITFATTVGGALGAAEATLVGDGACDVAAAYPPVAVGEATLVAVKTADRAIVCGDGAITWSITVSNQGTLPANNILIEDAIPAGALYQAGSIFGGTSRDDSVASRLKWRIASLPAGEGVTVGFRTPAPTSDGALVANVATLTADGGVKATTNAAAVRVDCDERLSLGKSVDVGCALPGEVVTVTLRYANLAGDLSAITVADLLPPALTFVAGSASEGGAYDDATRVVSFALANVPLGASGALTFEAKIAADAAPGSLILNGASVVGPQLQPLVSNGVALPVLGCAAASGCQIDACDPQLGCVLAVAPVGTTCETGDVCLDGACDAAGACVGTARDCDDGVFCNGVESCESGEGCVAGTAPTADDDGVDCTVASCNEETKGFDQVPTDSLCDNGLFCDGAERCDAELGCVAGAAPTADDFVACTIESCDEETKSIVHTPLDSACDDGLFCNGVEVCDAAEGCVAGTPVAVDDGVACTVDSCDEATGAAVHTTDDSLCDDGDACTLDTCTLAGCGAVASPADQSLWGWADDDDQGTLIAANAAGDLLVGDAGIPAIFASGYYVRWAVSYNGASVGAQVLGATTIDELLALSAENGACLSVTPELVAVSNPPQCSTTELNTVSFGAAMDPALGLNILACGDYVGVHDVEGAVAVAGLFAPLQGFSVGLGVPYGDPDPQQQNPELGEPLPVAYAGSVVAESGQFYGSVATFRGGDAIAADVNLAEGGEFLDGDLLDMNFLCGDVRAASLTLCAATDGTPADSLHEQLPEGSWWGETRLVVTHGGTNVFAIDGEDLSGSHTVFVSNPDGIADASVVVNVFAFDGSVQVERGEIRLEDGFTASDVLFNFCDTTAISIRGDFGGGAYGFYASLVAPFSALDFSYGQIVGHVIVASMVGDAELHVAPFTRPIVVRSTCDAQAPADAPPLPDGAPANP